MQRITKNTLLRYVPYKFITEYEINRARIYDYNNLQIKNGHIIYLCERELRVKDNFALQFALQKSNELNLPLKIIHLQTDYEFSLKKEFIDKQIKNVETEFQDYGLNFEIFKGSKKQLKRYFSKIDTAALVMDFDPISDKTYLKDFKSKIYEIDGHNIIPARFLSDKQEYAAVTIRRKIYHNIYPFLTEYDNNLLGISFKGINSEKLLKGKSEADIALDDFIQNRLPYYAELKNNPIENVLSGLSKYLNLGFISAQRVALEVLKSNVDDINKEIFLEELIIRKELSDNFCLYADNFKTFDDISDWAKFSLNKHKTDLRTYIYSLDDLEHSKTHDKLWNATQNQLTTEGVIHGYLRMYWAKKIMEWTMTPSDALNIAIYLNDKYAFDSPAANGYVGILWALGGLHDRAFADFPVTGKIRRMSYDSIRKKFNTDKYISKYK